MQKYLRFSKYHLVILIIYVLLLKLVIVYIPHVLNFDFSTRYIATILIISTGSLGLLYYWRTLVLTEQFDLRLQRIFLVTFYGTLFAIPEEILFRGVVQGYLMEQFSSVTLVVSLSSLTFGLAHLGNSAKGVHPRNWNWKFARLTFLAGFPLSTIFALTGSLLVPTILHVLFIIVLKLSKPSPKFP